MLLMAAILITSCSKSGNKPATSKPTVLLTKITNNQAGIPGYGKSFMEFTYSGKLLTKEVDYTYKQDGSIDNTETTTFNYGSNNNLTGTTITNSNSSYAAAYSGEYFTTIPLQSLPPIPTQRLPVFRR